MNELKQHEVQSLKTIEDLEHIRFHDDMAAVEVPVELLDILPLLNEERLDSERLDSLMQAIRDHGYNNLEPVIARLTDAGDWIVINGGHRITAARRISDEIITNIAWPKVRTVYFLLNRSDPHERRRAAMPASPHLPIRTVFGAPAMTE